MDFSQTKMANGNIRVYAAVMLDTTTSYARVIEATAGAKAIGIAFKGERRDPSNSDGFVAIAGEACGYWGNGAKDVPARIGVGGCTSGDQLKVGTNGRLVTASSDNDQIVAIANQTAVEDDIIPVDVTIGQRGS